MGDVRMSSESGRGSEFRRELAARHLGRCLGQPHDSPVVAYEDAGGRIGPSNAMWVLEFGRLQAPRCLLAPTVSIRRQNDHVRVLVSHDLLPWIADHLSLLYDGHRDEFGRPVEREPIAWARPWIDCVAHSLRTSIRAAARELGVEWLELASWPDGRPFAVTVSHDIDSLNEREPFALIHNALSLVNPDRDMLLSRTVAMRRFVRSLVRPVDPLANIRRFVELERELAIDSTYFMLLDERWSRHGARYELDQASVQQTIRLALDAGHEVGLHTGVSYFADADSIGRWVDRLRRTGASVESIRGHYLCFDHATSFESLPAARIRNDATFGLPATTGFRSGTSMPYEVETTVVPADGPVVEVPLGLMDVALFREPEGPAAVVERLLDDIGTVGGLLSVLWHNNYVNVPEYRHVEEVMTGLLVRALDAGAWCAGTARVRSWFDQRSSVDLRLRAGSVAAATHGSYPVQIEIVGPNGVRRVSLREGHACDFPLSGYEELSKQ